jgi:hypothetical protein
MSIFKNRVPLKQVIDEDKLDIAVVQSINAAKEQVEHEPDIDVKLTIEGSELDTATLVIGIDEK